MDLFIIKKRKERERNKREDIVQVNLEVTERGSSLRNGRGLVLRSILLFPPPQILIAELVGCLPVLLALKSLFLAIFCPLGGFA